MWWYFGFYDGKIDMLHIICNKIFRLEQLLKGLRGRNLIIKVISSSILGTFMALTCWIMGQAYIKKLALASIIGQTSLIFIMFFSWLFLREKITKTRIIASAFALIGVFLSNYFK